MPFLLTTVFTLPIRDAVSESLLQAANFVQSMEINTGMKIASIEEVACRMGYISTTQLMELSKKYKQNGYGKYLEKMANTI